MERLSKRRRVNTRRDDSRGHSDLQSLIDSEKSANHSERKKQGTEDVYESQVRSMLREIRSKRPSDDPLLDSIVTSFSSLLQSCEREWVPLRSTSDIEAGDGSKIQIPSKQLYDGLPESEVAFPKPLRIKALPPWFSIKEYSQSSSRNFQIGFELSSNVFEEEDHLNRHVLKKHNFYLALLARFIYDHSKHLDIQYFLSGDALPIASLSLTSAPGAYLSELPIPANARIEVHVFASPESFDLRLVKTPLAHPRRESPALIDSSLLDYKATLSHLMQTLPVLDAIESFSRAHANFAEVHQLLDIWLQKRGFDDSFECGGFGPFAGRLLHLSILSNRKVRSSKIDLESDKTSQVFKALLQVLATRSFHESPANGPDYIAEANSEQQPYLAYKSFSINVFGRMTPWSFKRLRSAARQTLDVLRSSSLESFRITFHSDQNNSILKFDSVFSLAELTLSARSQRAEYMLLYRTLEKALSDRVTFIHLQIPGVAPWSIKDTHARTGKVREIKIMLRHNHGQARSTLLRGPPAQQSTEALQFREFWGPKAELRRFKDGSILESVSWDTSEDETLLFQEILSFILPRHLPCVQKNDVSLLYPQPFLSVLGIAPPYSGNCTTPISAIFERLRDLVQKSKTLPLEVRQFVSKSMLPQFPSPSQVEVVVQFEGSAQWPDDFHAIRNIKIALLAKMAQFLRSQADIEFVSVALDEADSNMRDQVCLDLSMLGQPFRLWIHHDRDLVLLDRYMQTTLSFDEKSSMATSMISYQRRYVYGPLQSESIRLLALKYPFLYQGVFLFKSWCSYQRMTGHIPIELMELVVCQALLSQNPDRRTGSAQCLFLQAISTLASWDWMQQPLIVDFSLSMNKTTRSNIMLRFREIRASDPRMQKYAMVVATNQEITGTVWTLGRPKRQLAWRWHALATKALERIHKEDLNLHIRSLFSQSLADYHFVLRLRHAKSGPHTDAYFTNLKAIKSQRHLNDSLSLCLDFIREVQLLYRDTLLLFWSPHVPNEIPGIWLLDNEGCKLQGVLGRSIEPVAKPGDHNKAQYRVNKPAILNEIARLGGKMIQEIEVSTHDTIH